MKLTNWSHAKVHKIELLTNYSFGCYAFVETDTRLTPLVSIVLGTVTDIETTNETALFRICHRTNGRGVGSKDTIRKGGRPE